MPHVADSEMVEIIVDQTDFDVWLQPHLLPTSSRRIWIVPEAVFEEHLSLPRFDRNASFGAHITESYPRHAGTSLSVPIAVGLARPLQDMDSMISP
jgi:hypothetical protein